MSVPTITWRCGCRAEARDVGEGVETHPVDWELLHCPLHGAAVKMQAACKKILHVVQDEHERRAPNWNERLANALVDVFAALPSVEPKAKATEGEPCTKAATA